MSEKAKKDFSLTAPVSIVVCILVFVIVMTCWMLGQKKQLGDFEYQFDAALNASEGVFCEYEGSKMELSEKSLTELKGNLLDIYRPNKKIALTGDFFELYGYAGSDIYRMRLEKTEQDDLVRVTLYVSDKVFTYDFKRLRLYGRLQKIIQADDNILLERFPADFGE